MAENKATLGDEDIDYLDGEYLNLQYEDTPITIKYILPHTFRLKNKAPKIFKEINNKIAERFYQNRLIAYTMTALLEELKTVELDKN